MKVIGIVNQKGGVGKTATAAALEDGIARRGKKVLAIDFDPQGQLSASFGVRGSDVFNPPALKLLVIGGELVFERFSLAPYLDIVPAAIGLESANIALVGKVGREKLSQESAAQAGEYVRLCRHRFQSVAFYYHAQRYGGEHRRYRAV